MNQEPEDKKHLHWFVENPDHVRPVPQWSKEYVERAIERWNNPTLLEKIFRASSEASQRDFEAEEERRNAAWNWRPEFTEEEVERYKQVWLNFQYELFNPRLPIEEYDKSSTPKQLIPKGYLKPDDFNFDDPKRYGESL